MTALVEASDLHCGYGRLPIVRGIDVTVHSGEVVCLLGANGAGKTTTLLTLAGALPKQSGSLTVLGAPVERTGPYDVARRGLSMVPEGRGLFYSLTARQNIRLRRHRRSNVGLDQVIDVIPAIAGFLDRRVGLLSGGEQQMVAMACAMTSDPRVLLLDEACLGLAPVVVEQVLPLVRHIAKEQSVGVIMVEQHVLAALTIADRGYVLDHGRIVAEGTAADLRQDAERLEASYLGEDIDVIDPDASVVHDQPVAASAELS